MTREELLHVALLQATEEGVGIHLAKFADMCIEWGQQHPHWISIDDELPPCNVFVLTCDRQENTNLLMLAGDGRWYDKALGLHRNITHWMPLPSIEHLKD